MKLIVFAPFFTDFSMKGGSPIRIAGYTRGLNNFGYEYLFYSARKPDYVLFENHIECKINRRWQKVFTIFNLTYDTKWLKGISYLLRMVLLRFSGIKDVVPFLRDRLIWSHQDYTIALFVKNVFRNKIIIDIHGIMELQKESLQGINLYRKLWFNIYLKQEKCAFKKADFLNAVSKNMAELLTVTFMPIGKILIAPDGIPAPLEEYMITKTNDAYLQALQFKENDKIIIFAGTFKEYGGVLSLVQTYIDCKELNSSAKLILVGSGEDEKKVETLISNSEVKSRILRIASLKHSDLIPLMKLSDLIVCPDTANNMYNQITPHIKLYDAIATGKSVVAADIQVNKDLFPNDKFPIYYFSDNQNNNLRSNLIRALSENNNHKTDYKYLEDLTYEKRADEYLKILEKFYET